MNKHTNESQSDYMDHQWFQNKRNKKTNSWSSHVIFKKKSSLAVVKIKPGKNRLYLYYCLSTGTGVMITVIVTYQSYLCSALTMWEPNLLFISFSAFKFLVTRKSGEKSG